MTELEILYGVLENEEQRKRSWFYIREPLPYDTMPPKIAAAYSERHGGGADIDGAVEKLDALKARVDRSLGSNRSSTASWSTGRGGTFCVRGDPSSRRLLMQLVVNPDGAVRCIYSEESAPDVAEQTP